MRPLVVTADLAGGLAYSNAWGIALDGLLASLVWQSQKADLLAAGRYTTRVRDQDDPVDLELPLARCTPPGQPWHWMATCSWPVDPAEDLEVSSWTAAHDARDIEQTASSLPWQLGRVSGPYRTRHTPVLVTMCSQVTWHAVGDLERVRELLSPVLVIGKKRGSGHGQVLSWRVEPAGELTEHAAGHLHPDGGPGRPMPVACLPESLEAGGEIIGRAGVRPPYQHPARQHQLVLPRSAA